MVMMPTGPSTGVMAEVRKLTGLDANLCKAGVLLYDVDAGMPSGYGPARIRGARTNNLTCGPWSDATFGFGANEVSSLSEPAIPLQMTVLGADATGRYRVRLKR